MQYVKFFTQRMITPKNWVQPAIIALCLTVMLVCTNSYARSYPSRTTQFDQSKYAMLVIDAHTGTVLFQENAGKYRYPASLTKLMTLYLTFDAIEHGRLNFNSMLHVSAHAAAQSPTKLGLPAGSTIPLYDALMAVIIKSANDMAVVLAEALAGSESQFAVKMTQKARTLGMNHTAFYNASGLPDNRQKTTAYDLARLAMALYRDHHKYYYLFAKTYHKYKSIPISTHNRVMVSYRGADGLKTGYINASGFNLVTSAERNGKRLIGVVLGGRTARGRDAHMMALLDRGFAKLNATNDFNQTFAQEVVPTPMWKPGSDKPAIIIKKHKSKKDFSGRLSKVSPEIALPNSKPSGIELSNSGKVPSPKPRPKVN